mmetsp:Transcript_44506/g.126982  ORF Transcript_44506/g.126982 Transcript_44506/m.126982 type:complete len:240 (-) Transcript_44506:117-836(-)
MMEGMVSPEESAEPATVATMASDALQGPAEALPEPSDERLAAEVAKLLRGSDLERLTLRGVRAELERRLGLPEAALDARRDRLREIVAAQVARLTAKAPSKEAEPEAEPDAEAAEHAGAEADGGADAGKAKLKSERRKSKSSKSAKRSPSPVPVKKKRRFTGAKDAEKNVMTRTEFTGQAQTFVMKVGDRDVNVFPKHFSTGTCGFYGMSRLTVDVEGVPLAVQCQVSITAPGSKEWQD